MVEWPERERERERGKERDTVGLSDIAKVEINTSDHKIEYCPTKRKCSAVLQTHKDRHIPLYLFLGSVFIIYD